MKVLVIGSTGTIGRAVAEALSGRHEVIAASRSRAPHRVDIADRASIEALFGKVGKVGHVVSCAGTARFKPLEQLGDEDFAASLGNKLMGQVNLARIAASFVEDGGSITLTGGILARKPMPGSTAISLVNAGLEGFVRAAALELPRRIRINLVSPPWVDETLRKLGMDPAGGMAAAAVARAYVESVEGSRTGQTIEPGG